ncbi:hypothetical protein DdX_00503 [Ditylenchus destructor]|uniref:Uncharacterized protein n=1 Tax=Ditylenchus destructor TaxID=166010 RepID=A0AAD4RCZ8_9BILA|nr:hypothetical protein DdX_00503 [Ditylenchus destructor]
MTELSRPQQVPSAPIALSPENHPETGRSRKKSPIAVELQSLGDEELRNASFDIFQDDDDGSTNFDPTHFVPRLGVFGAPACRWTSSVMSLIGMMSGMVLATGGICILLFFIDEEPTIMPLGVTLLVVGTLLLLLGVIMWLSEFMCNDCLGKLHKKIQEAPLKNAIKRRSRMASRASNSITGSRAGSRLSEVSYRTNGTHKTVSTRY